MPYQNIPDTEFAEGQPARGITMIAMRDNLIAVAGGESGAPRVQPPGMWAIESGAVQFLPMASQNTWSVTDPAGDVYVPIVQFYIVNRGSITVNWEANFRTQMWLNGSVVYTNTSSNNGNIYTSNSRTALINSGDIVTLAINGSSGGTNTVRNVNFGTSGLPPIVSASADGGF